MEGVRDRFTSSQSLAKVLALLLLALSPCGHAVGGESQESDDGMAASLVSDPQCGPMSTYVLLRLLGRKVPIDLICNEVADQIHGMSVSEIIRVLDKNRVQALAIRTTPEGLLKISSPFIAVRHVLERTAAYESPHYHFIVVSSITDQGVEIIDGLRGREWATFADFLTLWEGSIVAPAYALPSHNFKRIVIAAGGSFAAAYLLTLSFVHRRWPVRLSRGRSARSTSP